MEENSWPIRMTALTRKDLEDIYAYIFMCLEAPHAAEQLIGEFEKAFQQISTFPKSCPLADDPMFRKKGYRKMLVGNFVGAYLINDSTHEIIMMRFFYGVRDYKRFL